MNPGGQIPATGVWYYARDVSRGMRRVAIALATMIPSARLLATTASMKSPAKWKMFPGDLYVKEHFLEVPLDHKIAGGTTLSLFVREIVAASKVPAAPLRTWELLCSSPRPLNPESARAQPKH